MYFSALQGRQLDRSEQLDSPGARVTGGSELSDIGAGPSTRKKTHCFQ